MTLKEQLKEKKAKLVDMEPALKAEDVSEDVIAQGEALATEIADLENKIELAEKAANVLNVIGTEDNTNNDTVEVKKMNVIEEFTKKAAEMIDKKSGVSAHIKAATDVVKVPQIADVDKSIAPQPDRVSAASLFSNSTVSGNAITYFTQGAYEGAPAVTAEAAKKPQNSTSFTGTTLALSKIACYLKESDEIANDAPWLASEIQNSAIYQLGKVEDAHVIGAIAGTSGIGAATYDADNDETFADGILKAIKKVKSDSAYDASVVILNPADVYTLLTAKDQNGQYYGGGYLTGAYGNGGYSAVSAIWGVQIFESTSVTAGTALVAAREAVKVWKKGGVDVKIYEQNEDDAIKNCLTLVCEERIACAVVDKKGVVALAAAE